MYVLLHVADDCSTSSDEESLGPIINGENVGPSTSTQFPGRLRNVVNPSVNEQTSNSKGRLPVKYYSMETIRFAIPCELQIINIFFCSSS